MSIKQCLPPLVMLALFFSSAAALSQEPQDTGEREAETTTPAATSEGSQTTDNSEPAVSISSDKPPSRFFPTEEISQDFSVAFPVDI